MQSNTTSGAPHGAGWNRWLLCPLMGALSAAALAASGAAITAPGGVNGTAANTAANAVANTTADSAANTAANAAANTAANSAANGHAPAPAATNYRVVQLSTLAPGVVDINGKGQVTFTETVPGTDTPRAKYYDGYTVRDIGTLGGTGGAVSQGINDRGQITGSASTPGGAYHAFLWSKATGMVDINGPGISISNAYALNNKGWVTGAASFSGTGPFTAFRWTPATGMVNLGSFGNTSYGYDINDAGTVVGYSEGPELGIVARAFKWTPSGGLQSLVSTSSVVSSANDINEAGKIVGSGTNDLALNDRALLWTPSGTQVDLGADSTFLSYAEHINEKGLVIGQEAYNPFESVGFVWSREHGILRFGTPDVLPSYVTDLNNAGQVVGRIGDQAIVWTRAGGVVNLNTRIPGAPPGLTLFQAEAVSDNGSIVAVGSTGLVLLVPSAAYHQAPVAAPIALTGATRVNALLSFSSTFRDVDLRDTHKATWTWGDGSSSVGTVSQAAGSGNVSGQHAWRKTGIYTVRLDILDSGGKRTAVERKVTICGCSSAVSGEGSFFSPAGARKGATGPAGGMAARSATGSFAFVADAGSARPGAGQAAVEVNVAGLALRSTAIDALAVNGKRVQVSGVGTVNGKANYRFTLATVAGGKSGAADRVRVRISHLEPGTKAEVVDYDNGASPANNAARAGAGGAGGLHADGSVIFGGALSQPQ